MKQIKKRKPWTKMNLKELREATRQFDKPLPPGSTRPLTTAQRARWERARKGPSISVYVDNSRKRRVVVVMLDEKLLKDSDDYARTHGISRDQLVTRSLKKTLASRN